MVTSVGAGLKRGEKQSNNVNVQSVCPRMHKTQHDGRKYREGVGMSICSISARYRLVTEIHRLAMEVIGNGALSKAQSRMVPMTPRQV